MRVDSFSQASGAIAEEARALGIRSSVGCPIVVGGSGLIGLRDRVEALGGSIQITSPAGEGTMIAVELPLRPA